MKDLGLLSEKYTALVTVTVQEEDCDGLCWQYIIKEDGIRPEFVVSTEPTDGGIYRGQRGRMEIKASKAFRVMAQHQNVEIMPFTKWRISYKMFVP